MIFKIIDYKTAVDFLLPRHYSGRVPQISIAFGWYKNERLMAVCTFGKPASPSLCTGIMGDKYKGQVYELNRLCREDDLDIQLSQFVSRCLRELKKRNWVIVSFSDLGMHHNGYIYQACNFIYTGQTKARTDKYTEGNKHSRHYDNDNQNGLRKVRTPKHRYIYFCASNKRILKEWKANLKYPILPYPKQQNQNYKLGFILEPKIISDKRYFSVDNSPYLGYSMDISKKR